MEQLKTKHMNFQSPGHNQNELPPVSLNRLVARLVAQLQPIAVKQQSFILNDVPGDFHVTADSSTLTMIIAGLLNWVTDRTYKSCIHVSVRRINSTILIRVKDSSSLGNYSSGPFWQKMNLLAARIGGCIIENETRKKGIITLSFSGLAQAA
jgi:hypothetical protein